MSNSETIAIYGKNLVDFTKDIKVKSLKIPFFQRQYRRKEKNWETSIEAIEYIKKGSYFMGSLILNEEKNIEGYDIIDGQQRITTLSIFLQALADAFEKENEIKDLIIKKITHNHIDNEEFQKVMKGEYKSSTFNLKEYKNLTSQIKKCYYYFRMEIENDKKLAEEDKKFNNIDEFFKNLGNIIFAVILLDSHNQQQIFDTLNSNSVSLTQAELIKNKLFKDKGEWENKWKKHFEESEVEYWQYKIGNKENIDHFLFALYYSNSTEGLTKTIKDRDLADKYNDAKWINLIDKNADIYKKIIKHNALDDKFNIKIEGLERLNFIIFALNVYTLIPYLFYLATMQNKEEVDKICKYLEIYLIRRFIADYETRGYNNLFVKLVGKDSLSKIKEELENKAQYVERTTLKMPLVQAFESGLTEEFKNNKEAKIVLYLIEAYKTNKKSTMSSTLDKFNEFTLEHINPQTPQTGFEYSSEMEKLIYNIGNMTLLRSKDNSKFSNKPWKDKKDDFKTYTANTFIMDEWIEQDMSNFDVLEKRCTNLLEEALEIWGDEPLNKLN